MNKLADRLAKALEHLCGGDLIDELRRKDPALLNCLLSLLEEKLVLEFANDVGAVERIMLRAVELAERNARNEQANGHGSDSARQQ
jgi:hypothetical protein